MIFEGNGMRQAVDNHQFTFGVLMLAVERVRVRYHHPIYIVYVGKHRNACLVHCKQRKEKEGQ